MSENIRKYHVLTLGCQMNHSDSERVKSVLGSLGWKETLEEEEANLIVVNACAIRKSAMDRIYGRRKKWDERRKSEDFKTLLTGCVLPQDKKKLEPHFDWLLDIKNLPNLPGLLGHENVELSDYFQITPEYNSKASAFIPIMTGCDKFCTFCAVPYTRGREISRPYGEILKEVKALVEKGCKEITLLGQNVNSYVGAPDKIVADRDVRRVGKQILNLRNKKTESTTNIKMEGTINFPELLQRVADVPGDFWIRFVTSHPYDMSDDLIAVMAKNKKICSHLNLAVQSGDDNVLKRMNRFHTNEHFKERVASLRSAIPDSGISTDIIVGFCGETDEEFGNTAQLMRDIEFDMAYIARYSPRPGTVAAKLFADDVPVKVKIKRDQELNTIVKTILNKKNKIFEGKTLRVLVEKAEKTEEGLFINQGRSETAKPVRFSSARDFSGEFVEVKIEQAGPWSLKGELA